MATLRRPVLACALSLGLLASTQAQERNWYRPLDDGTSFLEGIQLSQPGFSGMSAFDTGFLLRGSLGRYFDHFRGEVELDYRRNDLDRVTAFGFGGAAGGDVFTGSFMASGYYDFDTGTSWSPYVGGGIGGAKVSLSDVSAGGMFFGDDADTVLAYQFRAGIAYRFSEALDGTLGYRYFTTESLDFRDPRGGRLRLDVSDQHNFEIGVRLRF